MTTAFQRSWLVLLLALIGGLSVSWLLRHHQLAVPTVAWAVLGAALLVIGSESLRRAARDGWTRVAPPLHPRLDRALDLALDAVTAVSLALLWLVCGGIANPSALLLFAAPILFSCFRKPPQPLLTSVIMTLAVLIACVAASEDLRWQLSRSLAPGSTIWRIAALTSAAPFPEMRPTLGFVLTELVSATSLLLALGAAGRLLVRQQSQPTTFDIFPRRTLEEAPHGWLLLDDSEQPVFANSVARRMLSPGGARDGDDDDKPLVIDWEALVDAAELPALRRALSRKEPGVELPFVAWRHGRRMSRRHLLAYPVRVRGQRLRAVMIEDSSGNEALVQAADRATTPLLVLDREGSICYFNGAAFEAFPDLHFGFAAKRLAPEPDGAEWWREIQDNGAIVRLGGSDYTLSRFLSGSEADGLLFLRLEHVPDSPTPGSLITGGKVPPTAPRTA